MIAVEWHNTCVCLVGFCPPSSGQGQEREELCASDSLTGGGVTSLLMSLQLKKP